MSDPSNLEQLKAWIRGPHDFEQTAESLAPFLFKASWAEADIRGAMDYVIQRVRDIEFDLKKILKVAVQYPDQTGVTNVPEYIDLLKATLGANTIHFDFIEPGSMHLMLVELIDPKSYERGQKPGALFRRTIVALCKLHDKVEGFCVDLRKGCKEGQEPGGWEGGPEKGKR